MLLVYASDLAGFGEALEAGMDGDAELDDLLARLLTVVVERRLRRSLSRGYVDRREGLPRVRGRIDWLETECGMLLRRGKVMCRYQDLTQNTPRNKLVRVALEQMSRRIRNSDLAADCRRLAGVLAAAGVITEMPTRAEMSRDRIARHDSDDRLMVAASRLALDQILPSEVGGDAYATRLQRDEMLLRAIFEKAVAGLYRHELHGRDGWRVNAQKSFHWQAEQPTSGIIGRLPSMAADIVLERGSRRIVVDTKFTNALKPRRYAGPGFDSGHIYQLYAYLRSQAGAGDDVADAAEGILLYPAVDEVMDEAVTIQGHRLRFVAVDLSLPSAELRKSLLDAVRGPAATSPG
ncbi:5-methylcytosine-specific restriction system specificity protein McrC [Arthrobacter sp. TPD3018]|nr:5-methylcytosine-specific restriction system specificity protein McrC [Sphingomonas sp. TPD3009]PVE52876.1 5-methylcytosine-specific restriction system specificity protein McrC [Arthrobacter sp. TPD3018]PVE81264.1 5-methylcytosine-specific restriction system specificity protein McrC [Sphingomonas melonis]